MVRDCTLDDRSIYFHVWQGVETTEMLNYKINVKKQADWYVRYFVERFCLGIVLHTQYILQITIKITISAGHFNE